ncbi:MAG TPA: nickel-responsive transcriptional regulator NikR [Candidatus Nanoarchaeia archaeon]|nr:nickel-responsive transcriptional regulator NikR [Candidatus Nanoarchaeia archaeon]
MGKVTRTGISFDPKLLEHFDKFIKHHGYTNRSEAINDIVREKLHHKSIDSKEAVGIIKVTYDQRVGHYQKNVSNIQHDYHCQILSSTRTYLDHHTCLELIVVKGSGERIKKLFEKIKSLEGIKDGKLIFE